jgi:hypothetical protein
MEVADSARGERQGSEVLVVLPMSRRVVPPSKRKVEPDQIDGRAVRGSFTLGDEKSVSQQAF